MVLLDVSLISTPSLYSLDVSLSSLHQELRFDVEAATTGTPLLERRVRELETSNRALASQLVQFDRRGGKRKQQTLLLLCCVVVLWCCGVVVLWCCGVVVLWCCGVAVLMVCCSFGSTVTDV
jgi:hypothetical protein